MKTKKFLSAVAILAMALTSFSACSSDDKDDNLHQNVVGEWNMQEHKAVAKSNNKAVAEAIEAEINEVNAGGMPIGPMLAFVDFKFTEDFKFEFEFNFETAANGGVSDPESDWVPVTGKGVYEGSKNVVSITKFETIDLGNIKALIGMIMPDLDPAMLENLDQLANGFLPFSMEITEAKKGEFFVAKLNLTEIYNSKEKIASVIEAAKLKDVDPSKVTVEQVIVTVRCKAKK